MWHKILRYGLLIGLVVLGGVKNIRAEDKKNTPEAEKSKIEIVFVLDTTGSMGGLIEGAKLKIWAIVNEIMKAKPTPELKIGLIGYRDKGDEYVTKVFDISDNIDEIYKNLLSFSVRGGGDEPESVNKALDEAVNNIKWSQDKKPLKIIYLVGDSPPHMDYQDQVDYHKTVEAAVKKDLIVNTVRCGNNPQTQQIWQEIARLGEGKYVSIGQTGDMIAVDTPMDKELAELSSKLSGTAIGFGAEGAKLKEEVRVMDMSIAESAPSAPALAGRAEFKAAKGHMDGMGSWDLIDAVKNKRVKLEDIKDKDLPEEMKKMTLEERNVYIEKKSKERDEIRTKIAELSKKRAEFITEELKKKGLENKNSFDTIVIQNLKEQAAKKGIKFE